MPQSRKSYWQGITFVTDTAWGDSGKGKIVDEAAGFVDMVIKTNGGANAGHTVVNSYGEFKLHLVPAGVFHKNVMCIIATEVVADPLSLVIEIQDLQKKGIHVSKKNLLLSEDMHLVMPWHQKRDLLREVARKKSKIGTTGRGIGPTYADRADRVGLRMRDLVGVDFKKKFLEELGWQEELVRAMDGGVRQKKYFDKKTLLKEFEKARKILSPMVTNVLPLIWKYQERGKVIVGEAGQGALLDLSLGGYPYVTSSHPGVAGLSIATGIQGRDVKSVIGVTKAYTTRVGSGPMPTELTDATGKYLQDTGHEFGATTGRPRRCGWFDSLAVAYGVRVSGVTDIALTKLDVLDGLAKVKVCIGYKVRGKIIKSLAGFDSELIESAGPVYTTLPGWKEVITEVTSFEKLPKNAQKYILFLEKLLKRKITIVSVGPDRKQTMYR